MKALDLTEGPPLGRMLRFCLPVVAGNVFQMFYGAADAAAVGRLAGLDRLAAVGATGPLSFLVLGFLFGLTGGFSVVVSQRRGARDDALVVVTADHGGHDRTHGSDSDEDMTIPVFFWNRRFASREISGTSILDLAPTIVRALGVPPDPEWEGRPVDLP